MKKTIAIVATALLCLATAAEALAQTNGSNSSYSRFGMGLLNDQTQGLNRSMGGVSQGLRTNFGINKLNPASYSAIDSLTFLCDMGLSLQRTKMKLGDAHRSANNTNFEYINAAFRIVKNVGMSVGFQPFTSVGYSFQQDMTVGTDTYTGQNITNSISLDGSGGLHEAYMGIGWRPLRHLSVGANGGFLWGSIDHQAIQTFAENGTTNSSSYSSLRSYYNSQLHTWRADLGVQAMIPVTKTDLLTLGATVGIGHKVGGQTTMLRTALSGDTIRRTANKAFELPYTFSVGASWSHADKLIVAADATIEQWGKCATPHYDASAGTYAPAKGDYSDRIRLNAGIQYLHSRYDHGYFSRICYRAGAYYATPYQKIALSGQGTFDGPAQFGITAGLGLPIANGHVRQTVLNIYSPSYVNIGVEWARRKPSSTQLIAENIMRINIGITFNERWFQKWKFN
ncbi:MAG: hypothetical protein IJ209_07830 [Bacteroidaceae bacterium]|nr:hypothetical protein [Bacteroidaceae bacterium]